MKEGVIVGDVTSKGLSWLSYSLSGVYVAIFRFSQQFSSIQPRDERLMFGPVMG
ncbi:hypothetical protein LX36DRAFT_650763 [Colletotrichum falcatum]|nr:hypothetical protein LX36DRAFT_650763 [Colletotrichum falcatum]